MSCLANHIHNDTFYPKYKELYQKNEKVIKPFGFRMETIMGEVDMDLTEIHQTIIPDIQHWTIRTQNINLTLRKSPQNKTHSLIFQEELEKIKERYLKHSHVITDGSKLEKITWCVAVHKEKIFLKISQITPQYSGQKLVQSTRLLTSSQNQWKSNLLSFPIWYQCWNH